MSDMNFKVPDTPEMTGPRATYRASLPGLTIQTLPNMMVYNVLDISSGGLSFNAGATFFPKNENIKIRIIITGKVLIDEIEAKITRSVPNGMTAIHFLSTSRQNENKLDKLILEIQKRQIELQKKKAERKHKTDKSDLGSIVNK